MSDHYPTGADTKWVDPPSGWKYGFPRLYDPIKEKGISMEDFLIRHGYPEDEVEFALKYLRVWKHE